jgi:BirA family biotin operon repressor/biotin-[acetyl-CoA-carboxylase] ligase
MAMVDEVLELLADGQFHSGTELGRLLGVSRAAISKRIKVLTEAGVEVHRIPGRGYRLAAECRPLLRQRLLMELEERGWSLGDRLHLLDQIDSTNQYLLRQPTLPNAGMVCLAESQKQGRGRRGRGWVASPYRNIMLSMGWRFPDGFAGLSGLSLAMGVVVVRTLERFGVHGLGLKWPNDVLWQGKKLAGILVDVKGEMAGPTLAVIGLGLNVSIREEDGQAIDQPWTDMSLVSGAPVDRNLLAAELVASMLDALGTFSRSGLAPYQSEWEALHVHAGHSVRLVLPAGEVRGKPLGIDESGALLLLDESGHTRAYHSGEVSVRSDS